jgi:hypothetical protein
MLRHIGKEDLTVHSFKDRAAEKAGVAPEVAGAPPTHTVAAYQCADLSEMRRILTNERGRDLYDRLAMGNARLRRVTRSRRQTKDQSPLKRLAESFKEIRELSKRIRIELEAGRFLKIVRDSKTASSRLRKLGAILQHREIEEWDASLQEALLTDLEEDIPDILHRSPEHFLYTYIREVLRIDNKSSFDGPVRDAFAEAKLDPEQLARIMRES